MVLHFQVDGQPRNVLRGCTAWINANEIEDFFLQAAKPGFLLCTFGHAIYLSAGVYEDG